MNQHDPATYPPNQDTIEPTLFDSEPPQSPIPTKRQRNPTTDDGLTESQVDLAVTMLGSLLDSSQTNMHGSLMTAYLVFIDVLLHDLMGYRVMKVYMALFHHDDIIDDVDEQQANQLRSRFHAAGIVFRSLQWVDSIFARVYTKFLEINAQKQRKDHGQFYTPQRIVQFMWSCCLQQRQCNDPALSLVRVPRVFDPCMGMGAFLCEFLTRLIDACTATPSVWNNAEYLKYMLCHAIPENLWGVEIDPFAFKLGKLNVLVHLFPLYKRITELHELGTPHSTTTTMMINRLHLFCNDTLKLSLDNIASPWERNELTRLRDATHLKFDYIVTNPPYMIRKTGLVTEPDPALYDSQVLGGRGAQAYLYFMWICMQRCNPTTGQICLITPSQWLVLEFARHLRAWMWQHCQLLSMYQFEPYKVWPKVQTDSLIFRLRMRRLQNHDLLSPPPPPANDKILFLRHMSRKAKLDDILDAYTHFDGSRISDDLLQKDTLSYNNNNNNNNNSDNNNNNDPLLKYKWTSADNVDRIRQSPNASFAFLSPTSRLSDQLNDITSSLPRICDSDDAPLEFHRGPNTNPVYALVVRTQWARQTFGQKCCDRWLRPAFYWSGKSQGTDKESTFWLNRDPLRLTRKETSPAEAYVPLYRTDENNEPFYSMILVDKDDAEKLEKEAPQQYAALYQYLSEARAALQSNRDDRKIAWCHYNKCGVDVPVKIVHPINYGYFTKSQPRQRFFMDRNQLCLTNQCMYFTTKSSNTVSPPAEYFCGLLNSSVIQFFIKEHCSYDQQGRTRFFGKHLANIPCPLSPTQQEDHIMAHLVHLVSTARIRIYTVVEVTKLQTLMEKLRGGSWDLSVTDIDCLRQFDHHVQQHWRQALEWDDQDRYPTLLDAVIRTLQRASLCQYAIDHLAYALYQIPQELQGSLESELNLTTLTANWHKHLEQFNLAQVADDRASWGRCMIEMINSI
ncbi:S-adenosyl-L-methionine-dependent methyltransferase [Zychaea mexicana]|uniref:S-adenosyl-L-methionine-dependent methyltransferase n=1 Tax=Zychaea mexicana TaxID=64656 RepID=UPI0022FE3719|nr:S-adenosyl-L-methionine-dependent methyltransferase [Zychaea mexicana]KAI9489800.1 S-adenosyl-L-methionine-dependent methyltransferase [Zychaea mexicana]